MYNLVFTNVHNGLAHSKAKVQFLSLSEPEFYNIKCDILLHHLRGAKLSKYYSIIKAMCPEDNRSFCCQG